MENTAVPSDAEQGNKQKSDLTISSLRDIIATVLIAHPDHPYGTCCGAPDLEIEYQQDWALHVADAIIEAMIEDGAERWKKHPDNREFGAE